MYKMHGCVILTALLLTGCGGGGGGDTNNTANNQQPATVTVKTPNNLSPNAVDLATGTTELARFSKIPPSVKKLVLADDGRAAVLWSDDNKINKLSIRVDKQWLHSDVTNFTDPTNLSLYGSDSGQIALTDMKSIMASSISQQFVTELTSKKADNIPESWRFDNYYPNSAHKQFLDDGSFSIFGAYYNLLNPVGSRAQYGFARYSSKLNVASFEGPSQVGESFYEVTPRAIPTVSARDNSRISSWCYKSGNEAVIMAALSNPKTLSTFKPFEVYRMSTPVCPELKSTSVPLSANILWKENDDRNIYLANISFLSGLSITIRKISDDKQFVPIDQNVSSAYNPNYVHNITDYYLSTADDKSTVVIWKGTGYDSKGGLVIKYLTRKFIPRNEEVFPSTEAKLEPISLIPYAEYLYGINTQSEFVYYPSHSRSFGVASSSNGNMVIVWYANQSLAPKPSANIPYNPYLEPYSLFGMKYIAGKGWTAPILLANTTERESNGGNIKLAINNNGQALAAYDVARYCDSNKNCDYFRYLMTVDF